MKSSPLRRWLSIAGTVAVFGLVMSCVNRKQPVAEPTKSETHVKDVKEATKDTGAKGTAGAHDWTLFGGSVQRNLVNLVETNMPTSWSVTPGKEQNIRWSTNLGSKAYGGPIISGGKIFIGTNNDVPRNPMITGDKGVVMCFQERDGKFLWQSVHDKLDAGQVHDWPREGICSSAVVEGNRLWYVSNRCEVICADTDGLGKGKNIGVTDEKYTGDADADIVWRLDMMKELNVFPHNLATCSPLIVGDTLFIITSNGVDKNHITIPEPEAPSFLAIDKKTGKVKWKDNSPSVNLVELRKKGGNVSVKELIDKGLVLMHGQWSNPVYAEPNGKPQIIFPGGDGWIRAFNPANGELIWKFDCNPKDSFYKLGAEGTRSDFVSTPVIWENKLYIGVGQDPEHDKGVGHLWCIDITREPKNKDKDLSPASKPGAKQGDAPQTVFDPKDSANKDSGLVWHYGGPAGEDAERNYLYGRTMSTCAVHDGLCYASEYDGFVHCFDAKTGQKFWEHDMKSDTWSSPYWVDGKVYIGNEKGKMLIFQHGKEKKLLAEIEMNGKIRVTPVAVNGVLYVMTENPCKVYAITK
jgi:outer membrane protein assembly factor BamB